MALINCSECGKQVSDQAVACPACGNPIVQDQKVKTETEVKLVEYTAKKWKRLMLIGAPMSFIGLFMFIIGFMKVVTAPMSGGQAGGGTVALGLLLTLVGLVLLIVGKVGAWWNHG